MVETKALWALILSLSVQTQANQCVVVSARERGVTESEAAQAL
jgi:hypothetical protein